MTDTQHTGKLMLWIFWGMVLAALVYFLGKVEAKRYNPNQNPTASSTAGSNTVSLQRNPFGHYVSNGKVNGQDVVFMLDTGATNVALPASTADRLGLVRGPQIRVQTANGIATAYATKIKSLVLGNIELTKIKASIVPGMEGDEILLGMSALKQVDFSQSGNILTLTQYTDTLP